MLLLQALEGVGTWLHDAEYSEVGCRHSFIDDREAATTLLDEAKEWSSAAVKGSAGASHESLRVAGIGVHCKGSKLQGSGRCDPQMAPRFGSEASASLGETAQRMR